MKTYCSMSDIGSVLIGNDDWTFAVPNGMGDGISTSLVFDSESEFRKYKEAKLKNRKEHFISSAQGTFNIYDYDCAFEHPDEATVEATLTGRYGIYYIENSYDVIFVKWE